MAEISKFKFSEKEVNFSANHLNQLVTARFQKSTDCENGLENGLNSVEPENFPRVDPRKIPDLVEKVDGQWFSRDSGESKIFGLSSMDPIQLGDDGKFDLFSHLYQLLPDLQGKIRKQNFNLLQKALLDERNFSVPVSETVSIFYFLM